MHKEQIYDEKISPLMKHIIEICKENHISMVANFQLGNDPEKGELQVTTCLPDETGNLPANHRAAMRAFKPVMAVLAMTISVNPENKENPENSNLH